MVEKDVVIKEKLSLKNDYVFKRIFSKEGNEEYLKEFLSDLLKLDIKEIKIEHDVVLEKNLRDEKVGILDIKATLNENTIVDIEMQMVNEHNIIKRSLFYAGKMIAEQLKVGEMYKQLKPVIVIFIMDFNYFNFDEYITESKIVLEKHREYELTDNIKLCYVELPKFRKSDNIENNKTSHWLTFLDGEKQEELKKVMSENNLVKKANEELEYLSGDEEARRMAELRLKYKREMASMKNDGIEIGMEIGKKQGIKEGIKEGQKRKQNEIAKKMIKKGIEIDIISEITGFSKQELNELNAED